MARESILDFSASKCEAILVIIGSTFRQSTVRIGRSETVIILGVIKNGMVRYGGARLVTILSIIAALQN